MKNDRLNRVMSVAAAAVAVVALLVFHSVGVSALVLALGAAVALGRLTALMRDARTARREGITLSQNFMLKAVATFMGLFLVTGTALLMWAFTITAPGATSAEYLFRSFICSLDMFMLDVDNGLLDNLEGHEVLKGMLLTQAVLSFACTVALLFSLVVSRARAYWKLRRRARVEGNRNHLYIFFGVNEPSMLLAADIAREDRDRALVVFVDEWSADEDETDGWSGIVNMMTLRRRTLSLSEETDAFVASTDMRLCDIAPGTEDVLGRLSLGFASRMASQLGELKTDGARLNIFLLSDNEEENIQALSILAGDRTVAGMADKGVELCIYVHARRSGPNSVVSDLAVSKGLDVRLVDSSHLAVEVLKRDPEAHPVKLVELSRSEPATVSSPLTALVVGMGEAGRDAVKFIYEFGAFVAEGSTDKCVTQSPLHIVAVDRDMDSIEGRFRASMPGMRFGPGGVELMGVDYNHGDFYTRVLTPSLLSELNYVVIAVGDDDAGISLATRIFEQVRMRREDLSRLRVMVRCYREEKRPVMERIARHFNEGHPGGQEVIRIFGGPKEIYSYANVVDNSLERDGSTYLDTYNTLSKGTDGWKLRHALLTGMKRMDEKTGDIVDIPVDERRVNLDRLRSLRRKEGQDVNNVLHAATKMHILRHALGGEVSADFVSRYLEHNELTDTETLVLERLAMLEHLRWNASHEVLGYVRAREGVHRCDERTREHNCLIPWEELDAESAATGYDYKGYDRCVVTTTVSLYGPGPK